ncbi:hypothetical protein Tco_0932658 [Tanacetum coccineum]
MGGVLEKDLAPHLTARQEQTVKLLESHKAPFRRTDIGLLDFIKTADPQKVWAVEVHKGDDQVKLLESTQHCFVPLVIPAAGGSSSAVAAEIPAPIEGGQEDVAEEDAYLELADPDEGTAMVRQSEEEVVTEQSKKVKKRRLQKQSDVLPAKKLRTDHPALASGAGGKTLAGLEQIRPAGSRLPDREQFVFPSVAPPSQESEGFLDSSARTNLRICTTVESSSALAIPVDTTAAATTSTGAAATTKLATDVNPDLAGPSHPEESEGSDDSFYSPTTLDPSEAKRWYVPRWSITNDSLLDDGFSCRTLVDRVAPPAFFFTLRSMDYDQLYMEFNVGAARQMCLGAEVRSRAEHELELKEKLRVKYAARSRLLEEKDLEILKLKSKLAEKEAEAAEVIRLRDQVLSLSKEKSALTTECSCFDVGFFLYVPVYSILRKDGGFSRNSRPELYNLVSSLSTRKWIPGQLDGNFYPTYLNYFGRKKDGPDHEIQLALLKCLKSPEYQGTLGHALGRAVDFGEKAINELLTYKNGLEVGHEHGIARRSLFAVDAYNPKTAKARYFNAVKTLEDVDYSVTWVGEASTSVAPFSVKDYDEEDTDEAPCTDRIDVLRILVGYSPVSGCNTSYTPE